MGCDWNRMSLVLGVAAVVGVGGAAFGGPYVVRYEKVLGIGDPDPTALGWEITQTWAVPCIDSVGNAFFLVRSSNRLQPESTNRLLAQDGRGGIVAVASEGGTLADSDPPMTIGTIRRISASGDGLVAFSGSVIGATSVPIPALRLGGPGFGPVRLIAHTGKLAPGRGAGVLRASTGCP